MESIVWDVIDSPLGALCVAARDDGAVRLVLYGSSRQSALKSMKALGKCSQNEQLLQPVTQQLRDYFARRRQRFQFTYDLQGLTPFQQDVLLATMAIPYGQVTTYKDIAQGIGRPRAVRAVGAALGRNPIGILIPCHRVVASDGGLGGFSGPGGLKTKRFLLELEGGGG